MLLYVASLYFANSYGTRGWCTPASATAVCISSFSLELSNVRNYSSLQLHARYHGSI